MKEEERKWGRILGASASKRPAKKGAKGFRENQERMFSWKPHGTSKAPGRQPVAHTRRLTEELNEGTLFKSMTKVKRTKIR